MLLSGALAAAVVAGAPAAQAAVCTPVNTSRGLMTAAVVDANVTAADIDAAPCQIGVYYSPGSGSWTVDSSHVHNPTDFGVFNDGANVTVDDSQVDDVGDNPNKTGVQHGVGIFFGNSNDVAATGTISDSAISDYQKGGVVINGANSSASITGSTVTGLGKIEFIAQNGIQISRGATPGDVSGNTVTDNHYSGPSKPTVSSGILLFQANITGRDVGLISSSNEVNHNQANIFYIK